MWQNCLRFVKKTAISHVYILFHKKMLSSVNDSPKALNYRIYKDNLVFENYLNILNDKDNLTLSIFKTTNHKLPVENGRWKT